MDEAGEPIGPRQIAEATGMKIANTRMLMSRMKKDGVVKAASKFGKMSWPTGARAGAKMISGYGCYGCCYGSTKSLIEQSSLARQTITVHKKLELHWLYSRGKHAVLGMAFFSSPLATLSVTTVTALLRTGPEQARAAVLSACAGLSRLAGAALAGASAAALPARLQSHVPHRSRTHDSVLSLLSAKFLERILNGGDVRLKWNRKN